MLAKHLPSWSYNWLDRVGTPTVLAAAVLCVTLVGLADYVTGIALRIYPLYFVPVAMVSWRIGNVAGHGIGVLCAAVWLGANWDAGMDEYGALVNSANTLVQLIAFATIAGLVSRYRAVLAAEQLLARSDPLTSLLNRRGLADRAEVEIARSRRTGSGIALALVDLDHFKQVNDTRGHAAGDALLAEVGAVMARRLRHTDVAARLGGDEFAILMADTDAQGAAVVLGQIHEDIAAVAAARRLPVTASIGVCVVKGAAVDLDEMLRRADASMYDAKHGGRNLVVLKAVDEPPRAVPI